MGRSKSNENSLPPRTTINNQQPPTMKHIITQSEILSSSLIEAHKRGLPKGWTVSFDNHNRKQWTSPLCNDGKKRGFDSIPKALRFIEKCELKNYIGKTHLQRSKSNENSSSLSKTKRKIKK